ncbi:MAG: DEAD/DEAH box helicase family protein [Planctomycetes bacterium]|nr:DEAD/DEAH box helicase family protein [Planctomycetota bacterium]
MVTRGASADTTTALDPDAPLVRLPGIGPTTAARLAAAGLRTVGDLVRWFPRRYRALRELESPDESALGELVRLRGTVHNTALAWLPGRRAMVTVTFAAADGALFAARFFNQPWLRKNYAVGQRRAVEGTLARKSSRWLLETAKILPLDSRPEGEVQLRYPEVAAISHARLAAWIAAGLERVDCDRLEREREPLPPGLEDHDGSVRELLFAMHRPADIAAHERARLHFAVREAVALFEAVERARRARAARPARAFPVDEVLAQRILGRIPLQLTGDQDRAVRALWQGLAGPAALGALLQGDVGTGKTAVAVAAALAVLARGASVAFLAPTELLAEQHHATVSRWLADSDVRVQLLTATTRAAAKNTAEPELPLFEHASAPAAATTGPALWFGTHALLSLGTELPELGLAIVDEQHRFGVDQRMALVHKGSNPHVLVMTATPIPRTFALTLFGDLDVLTLRQRPPGQRPVPAVWLATEQWQRALQSIARAVRRGGRVFVVCPAVGEEGEKGGVIRLHAALSRAHRCGLVHGRMKPAERQAALDAFRAGAIDVLVGTTVLEVGVDVPAATLVVVVNADRFGIATLHQLRGRVGRGRRRGLCLLCGPRTARIRAVCGTTDGFALAEADLAIRGSGELLGTAQSGFVDLRALDPSADLELLLRVRAAVRGGVAEPTASDANGTNGANDAR